MVKQSKPIQKPFACRVYGAPIRVIDPSSIALAVAGIGRRIQKEANSMYRSVEEDFIEKKKDNIARLRIIRRELKQLQKQL
jgi:hypothetical protein